MTIIDESPHRLQGTDYLLFVEAILTLLVNLLLLILILKESKLRQKKANKFFINLLLVHCFLCIITLVSGFFTSSTKRIFKNGILIQMFLSLMIISIDRFMNIKYPFKYQRLRTKHVSLIIVGSWIPSVTSIVLCVILGITAHHCVVICTILIVLASICLTVTNLNIFRLARHHSEAIAQQRTTHASKPKSSETTNQLKVSLICFASVLSFILLWFPYFVHNILALANVYKIVDDKLFTLAVVKFALLNSLMDPLLFIALNKDARHVFLRLRPARESRCNRVIQQSNSTEFHATEC